MFVKATSVDTLLGEEDFDSRSDALHQRVQGMYKKNVSGNAQAVLPLHYV